MANLWPARGLSLTLTTVDICAPCVLLRRRPAAIPQRRQRKHASATGRGQCPWCVAAAPTRSPALLLAQLRDAARYARGVRWAVHPALGGEACWRGEHECLDVSGVGTELAPPRTERVHVLSAIVHVRAHAARAVSRSTMLRSFSFHVLFASRFVVWTVLSVCSCSSPDATCPTMRAVSVTGSSPGCTKACTYINVTTLMAKSVHEHERK